MEGQPEIIPHGREEPRPPLGFLTAKHPTSFVKLRDSFTVNERLRLEVGYDVDLRGTGRSAPWASLHFQARRGRRWRGAVAAAGAASGAWHLHAKLELHAAAACMLGLRCSGCKP